MNEFQKGHSHIAVVIKSKKEVMENPEKEANPRRIKLNMNLNSSQRHLVIKGKIKLKLLSMYLLTINVNYMWNLCNGNLKENNGSSIITYFQESISTVTLKFKCQH